MLYQRVQVSGAADSSSSSVDPHINDGGEEHAGLSGRSQALGAVLSLLLVVLTICLLVLLLHKRDRRQYVIQKVSSCCKKGNPVSYKYSRVNMDEDGCEDEMEWLMEETETPTRKPQQNGHVTTKPVSTDAAILLPGRAGQRRRGAHGPGGPSDAALITVFLTSAVGISESGER